MREELKTVIDEEKMKEIMATELEPVHEQLKEQSDKLDNSVKEISKDVNK